MRIEVQRLLLRMYSTEQLADMFPFSEVSSQCMSRVTIATADAVWITSLGYSPREGTILICNREEGHSGPHIAWGFGPLVAWPNKESKDVDVEEG